MLHVLHMQNIILIYYKGVENKYTFHNYTKLPQMSYTFSKKYSLK